MCLAVIFQVLSHAPSSADAGQLETSLHTQTARWVAQQLLEAQFDEQGEYQGRRAQSPRLLFPDDGCDK